MKYGIEFEFFVSKNNKIVPAYLATNNLDGNPFLGEIKTEPFDNITDCIFSLKKLIFLEQLEIEKKGFKMEIISTNKFTNEDLIAFRKNASAINKKELEVLDELSIYPSGKIGKILKRGEIKASLQINLSENKSFSYLEYQKVTIDDKYKYESFNKQKEYSCIFDYVSIIQKLDILFNKDISDAKRTKGVYAIKQGIYGDRIEYRSLPNTINFMKLLKQLNLE